MITRVRSAVSSIIGGIMASGSSAHETHPDLPPRFPYSRPDFLALSPDEVECSADHISRPILILKEMKLPWATGYAEVINAGKSALNEDQACCETVSVRVDVSMNLCVQEVKEQNFHYWALFDGHGGSGAAVFAAKFLHLHIEEQLQEVLEILQNPSLQPPTCLGAAGAPGSPNTMAPRFFMEKKIKQESLVVGAIENAFKEMDAHIARERMVYCISGGCTALAVVYLLGKLYVANAGDSRALIIRGGEVIPVSSSFTPESERQRLQFLAHLQPSLLGNEFTHLEFPRRVTKKELGKRMLYRDFTMNGWAYKTVQEEDLKFPLVYGEGKKARVLATIGITRGLGDHDLKVHDSDIAIKPFLSCSPEVKIYNLSQYEHGADDVMILATDGLWDVLSNQEVAEAVSGFLGNCDPDDQHRYTMAAQDLVMKARGVLRDRGWRIAGDRLGSGDDISVFIIPLMHGDKQPPPS
uniref:Protein phosphatase, Mg2+/Mn2+ dependent, 1H n=2 Tax=Cyprinus carpio TaxID=7962 RepID=A0A9J7XGV7_CYPCA